MYKQLNNQFMIKCVVCKKDILRDHVNRRKCADCVRQKRLEGQRRRYLARHVPKRQKGNCVVCGEEFLGLWHNKKYCSNECSKKCRMIKRKENTIQRLKNEIDKLRIKK